MAVRLNARQTEGCKARIKTTLIVEKLQKHLDGEIELTDLQVKVAKILLDKTMGNAPTEIIADVTADVTVKEATISKEWLAELIARANDKG